MIKDPLHLTSEQKLEIIYHLTIAAENRRRRKFWWGIVKRIIIVILIILAFMYRELFVMKVAEFMEPFILKQAKKMMDEGSRTEFINQVRQAVGKEVR